MLQGVLAYGRLQSTLSHKNHRLQDDGNNTIRPWWDRSLSTVARFGILTRSVTSCHLRRYSDKQLALARFVSGDYRRESSVMNMISNIGWQSVEERRAIARLTLSYKIVHGLVDISTSPLLPSGRQTRHTSHLSYLRLQFKTNCFLFPTYNYWMELITTNFGAVQPQHSHLEKTYLI